MAKITPGPLAAAISGSIGGTVFSHNRGGPYVRLRSIPTNPSTEAQESVRAILSSQSQAWSDLDNEQRAAWTAWAGENPITDTLGSQVTLSGHMAFVQLNARIDLTDDTTLVVPPVLNAPLALDSLALSADIGAGDFEVAFTATPLITPVELWIEGAIVTSAGKAYVRNLFRFLQVSADGIGSPFNIEVSFTAKFGVPQVGQTAHVRVRTYNPETGLVSVPLTSSAVVVSTV